MDIRDMVETEDLVGTPALGMAAIYAAILMTGFPCN